MKLKKYWSDGGWGIEVPFLRKDLIFAIIAGLAVTVGVEVLQRRSYFKGVTDVDKLTEEGIA